MSNIPLVGGIIGQYLSSQSKSTGIFHDENGIFIPWSKICNIGQQYLQQDCSQLIDQSTGALTADGEKAVGCIRNGAIIAAVAEKHGLNAAQILGYAAPTFGCGGIADLNQMQNSPAIQAIVSIIKPLVP